MWSSVLILLLLPVYIGAKRPDWEDEVLQSDKAFCSWKCLTFSLQWPAGFCQSLDKASQCLIPEDINSWTIHGLWPLHVYGCCSCWPMFHSDVQELEAELNKQWPSLLKSQPSLRFWEAEWRKHGVCAACVEGMNSPLKYFQANLKLRAQFDIGKLLKAAGITPSCDQLYKDADIRQVLTPHLGKFLEIQCTKDDKGREVWFQVKMRLSRNMTVGCDTRVDASTKMMPLGSSDGHPCPTNASFYYLPINHQQPGSPCSPPAPAAQQLHTPRLW